MDYDKNILVSGATGFIGKFLIDELIEKGYKNITALVRLTSDTALLESKGVKLIYADISDENSLNAISEKYDIIFHCAGFVNNNVKMLQAVNTRGTRNLCQLAYSKGTSKFIYVSSVAVNSGNTQIPLNEDLPYSATNTYGVSKIEAEKTAIEFSKRGLPMAIIRPCMVYGEGEPHVMPFLAKLLRLRLLFLPSLPNARWHLVSVRNVAACLVCCMEDDRALGRIFNIADREVLTVREVFETIAKGFGISSLPVLPYFLTKILMFLPYTGKRIKFLCKDRVYSIDRLRNILNFVPPYPAISELLNTGQSLRK